MLYRDVVDKVLPRARRLGLLDAETGQVDAVEVETALLSYMQWLVAQYDLDAFTVINENMGTTTVGDRDYALPEDFGRLFQPEDRDEHGIFLHDGTHMHRLTYRKPDEWLRLLASSVNRPSYFTISGRTIQLDPAPNTNTDSNYTLRGAYIRAIQDIDLDATLPIPLRTAEEGTLAQMAADFASPSATLLTAKSSNLESGLVNQQRRTRQPFQRRAQWSRKRGTRR